MPTYRKRPVEVEARQVPYGGDPDTVPQEIYDLAQWCRGYEGYTFVDGHWFIDIPTLEGTMRANPGTYIIRGVHGEFYPCDGEIFHETYEAVE